MKPRVFIGSSVEGLDIAYAIQQNLEYDATVTVWTQGIFQLSSNSLDDLLAALENFDFGIFIFKPDDVAHLRNDKVNVVRDNVIFELGLFFGRLGKNRVFFVKPQNTESFHLPTDLLGVMAGSFDNTRNDTNLQAALGPFCNQVRQQLKSFVFESMIDLAHETAEAKAIAFEQKPYWKAYLMANLLRARMNRIQKRLDEIQRGHVFRKTKQHSLETFMDWFGLASKDFTRCMNILQEFYVVEMNKTFTSTENSIQQIKELADKVFNLCNELLEWEIELHAMNLPQSLQDVPKLMMGWAKAILRPLAEVPSVLEEKYAEGNINKEDPGSIHIVIEPLPNVEEILEIFEDVNAKIKTGKMEYD